MLRFFFFPSVALEDGAEIEEEEEEVAADAADAAAAPLGPAAGALGGALLLAGLTTNESMLCFSRFGAGSSLCAPDIIKGILPLERVVNLL